MPKSHELLFQHMAPLTRLSLFHWEDFYNGYLYIKNKQHGYSFLIIQGQHASACHVWCITSGILCLSRCGSHPYLLQCAFFTSSFLYFHKLGTMYSPNHTQFMQYFPPQSICISSSIQGAQTRQVSMCYAHDTLGSGMRVLTDNSYSGIARQNENRPIR